ncbi:hypothetical protein H5410_061937 [Solanum commersonii]|uniref:Uncharacterized protein n=1 Tax=Solanum commersonii TaxID=4109 RepID=A0A9J5W927_SOLCO|nr:hypothetical protein H5410_061937 [Solanum commersonii]
MRPLGNSITMRFFLVHLPGNLSNKNKTRTSSTISFGTNRSLSSTFVIDPASYSRCIRPGLDNIDHIFINGNFANYVWRFFSSLLGLTHAHVLLRNHLMNWCSAKYGGKQSNIAKLIRMIETCQHETKIKIIKRNRPTNNIHKLNTDGSALNNPRRLEENAS